MKHRSPLVTLAAVALAFAIMFTVNMLSGPPGSSSTGTAGPSAAPATATASSPSPQPTETAVATPSASPSKREDSKFGEKVVYAGRTDDDTAAIAVAVLGDQAAAYLCDGRNVEAWFRGAVDGGDLSLKSKSGATLQAELDGDHIKGTVKIKNDTLRFEINEAKKPSGLYRARGSQTTIGWIVLEDGSQVGVQTSGADSSAAPRAQPGEPAGHGWRRESRCRTGQRRRRVVSRGDFMTSIPVPAPEAPARRTERHQDRPRGDRLCHRNCGLHRPGGVWAAAHTDGPCSQHRRVLHRCGSQGIPGLNRYGLGHRADRDRAGDLRTDPTYVAAGSVPSIAGPGDWQSSSRFRWRCTVSTHWASRPSTAG